MHSRIGSTGKWLTTKMTLPHDTSSWKGCKEGRKRKKKHYNCRDSKVQTRWINLAVTDSCVLVYLPWYNEFDYFCCTKLYVKALHFVFKWWRCQWLLLEVQQFGKFFVRIFDLSAVLADRSLIVPDILNSSTVSSLGILSQSHLQPIGDGSKLHYFEKFPWKMY